MAMVIGVARVAIYLPEASSLKDKRQVVRSITQRLRNQYNAAIAEIEDLNDMRVATLGVSVVSNSGAHADDMLAAIIAFIERNVELGTLGEVETELIHV